MIEYKVTVDSFGTRKWYVGDNLHRLDGPAVEYVDGNKYWYLNNVLHREDGPAIQRKNGTIAYCLNGVEINKSEFYLTQLMKGMAVDIDGRKYRLTVA